MRDIDNGGSYACVRAESNWKSLYHHLRFAVKLKLLLNSNNINESVNWENDMKKLLGLQCRKKSEIKWKLEVNNMVDNTRTISCILSDSQDKRIQRIKKK